MVATTFSGKWCTFTVTLLFALININYVSAQNTDTLREEITSRVNAQADEIRRNVEIQRNQTEQRADQLRTSSIRNAETLRAELSAQNQFPTRQPSSDDDRPISGGGDTVDRIVSDSNYSARQRLFGDQALPVSRERLVDSILARLAEQNSNRKLLFNKYGK